MAQSIDHTGIPDKVQKIIDVTDALVGKLGLLMDGLESTADVYLAADAVCPGVQAVTASFCSDLQSKVTLASIELFDIQSIYTTTSNFVESSLLPQLSLLYSFMNSPLMTDIDTILNTLPSVITQLLGFLNSKISFCYPNICSNKTKHCATVKYACGSKSCKRKTCSDQVGIQNFCTTTYYPCNTENCYKQECVHAFIPFTCTNCVRFTAQEIIDEVSHTTKFVTAGLYSIMENMVQSLPFHFTFPSIRLPDLPTVSDMTILPTLIKSNIGQVTMPGLSKANIPTPFYSSPNLQLPSIDIGMPKVDEVIQLMNNLKNGLQSLNNRVISQCTLFPVCNICTSSGSAVSLIPGKKQILLPGQRIINRVSGASLALLTDGVS